MRDEILTAVIAEWVWPYKSHDDWHDQSGKFSGDAVWYCDSEDYPNAVHVSAEKSDEHGWYWWIAHYELDSVSSRNEFMSSESGGTPEGLREAFAKFARSIGATRVGE